MKWMYLPTLADMREMLGEDLYVKMIWAWREQEQDTRARERRARLCELIPERKVESWPAPAFVRAEDRPVPASVQAVQKMAMLRPPRSGNSIEVGELAGLIERASSSEAPREREAAAGGRRRR